MTPQISAVIITRHRPKPLENCLRTLDPFREQGLEVIVVDNSDDEATAQMARGFPWVNYQRVPHAKNFQTATRNRGLQEARAPIVAYLDDDVTVKPTWFDACLEGYRQGVDVGGVGGRVLDHEVEGRDFHRDAPICKILPNGELTDNLECDPGRIIEVDHARGCNFSVRRDFALRAGAFDEQLMGYGFQDLDLLLRIRKLGYRILFHPKMEVYHHLAPRDSQNRYGKDFRVRFHRKRNLSYVYAKHSRALAWRHLWRCDTGLRALVRQPSGRALEYVVSGYLGKLAGFLRALAAG